MHKKGSKRWKKKAASFPDPSVNQQVGATSCLINHMHFSVSTPALVQVTNSIPVSAKSSEPASSSFPSILQTDTSVVF